jgi:hypothetical protein
MEPGPCSLFVEEPRIKSMKFEDFKVAMLSKNLSLPKFVYMMVG